jgi:hypothetical protein
MWIKSSSKYVYLWFTQSVQMHDRFLVKAFATFIHITRCTILFNTLHFIWKIIRVRSNMHTLHALNVQYILEDITELLKLWICTQAAPKDSKILRKHYLNLQIIKLNSWVLCILRPNTVHIQLLSRCNFQIKLFNCTLYFRHCLLHPRVEPIFPHTNRILNKWRKLQIDS